METIPRTQTAFRLKDSLLERIKWRAKREKKSVNAFVEEVLEEAVGTELAFPKLPPEFFEKATELDGQFVLRNSHLPAEYDGLDASGQATVDKNVLADARYEKDLTRG